MNQHSTLVSSTHIPPVMPVSVPLFTGDTSDEVGQRWGALFAVFSKALEQVTSGMTASAMAGDLHEQLPCASRRYSAMLERMCLSDAKSAAHALVFEVAEGFTVIMMSGGPHDSAVAEALQDQFDNNQPYIPEDLFTAALAKAMDSVFVEVAEQGRYIEVQIGTTFYVFTRSKDRDEVLQEMGVGTQAKVY